MAQVSGFVELEITYNDGQVEFDQIDGSEFGLEEGGDHIKDRDDGEIAVGYLFIAFRDAFDVILTASYHGGNHIDGNLIIRPKDYESYNISAVVVANDQLEIENP
ncbi:hypothetical protein [Undibacterium sp. TC9W]|uniref:hypothetical protein n=1 Tax=Undibacterium sp. TC9W TaxID=3413053 RepID=UPI003BF2249A